MTEIILHHYNASPFSEKVRLMLGAKGLAWRSVIQPVIMPKPDLTPLTGGYRRIPVMQIGADIYCDSQVMMAELDRRHPETALASGGDWAVNLWADRLWFQASVAVIFGEIGDNVPQAFIDDREKLSGRPFDVAAMKAAAPFMRGQWRTYAAWLEDGLAAGDYLGGSKPSLADVAAWMNIWWTGAAARASSETMLAGFTRTQAWRDRMKAIGHGARTEMTPTEALHIARVASPAEALVSDPHDLSGLVPGDPVTVQADDYGRDPIIGELAAVTRSRITVSRDDADLGRLNVHFPRAGYLLARR